MSRAATVEQALADATFPPLDVTGERTGEEVEADRKAKESRGGSAANAAKAGGFDSKRSRETGELTNTTKR